MQPAREPGTGRRMKLLIADGDATDRFIARRLIEDARGDSVIYEAPDVQSCLRLAREQHPDLLVLHARLGGGVSDAMQVISDLRANEATRDIEVVGITAYVRLPAEAGFEAQGVPIFSKWADGQRLADKARALRLD